MSRRIRPRGFAPWRPRPETLEFLTRIQAVLDEYRAYLPLSCRQVFYRLVGAHGYEKTEQAYARLCDVLNRARRAGLIPFAAIRDDGTVLKMPDGWDGQDQLVQALINAATDFRLDRQDGQPARLLFAVEASGMVPQVERIAAEFGIPVHSSGGFDSLTAKHDLACMLSGWSDAEVLHIGDHDPSGVHVFTSLAEDVQALAHSTIRFTRLAVTPEQIASLRLATAPAKPTDRRTFTGETVQAEAIPPDVLAGIVRTTIEERLDHDAFAGVLAEEDRVRTTLRAELVPMLTRFRTRQ